VLTQEQGVGFMQAMLDAWNARDRNRWLSFFADDFAEEMPAGSPPTKAPETLTKAWDDAFGPGGAGWKLESVLVVVCGNEIAVHGRYPGNVGGRDIVLDSIEIWNVDDDLKAHYCRAFFEPFGAPSE
jgi:hypothetical protein